MFRNIKSQLGKIIDELNENNRSTDIAIQEKKKAEKMEKMSLFQND